MIRKFLSILAIAAMSCSNNEVQGQICTPDANLKVPGFLPMVLPDAQKDVPYSQAITVLAFKDTSVKQGNLTLKVYIDSMKNTGITGLPNGMSYNCLNARCVFTPAALSCVKLSGTPNESGIFPLKIAILAYAKVSGVLPTTQKDTIESFVLNVSGSASTISLSKKALSITPNPASQTAFVNSEIEPLIYNSLGQLQSISVLKQELGYSLNIQNLLPGIYTVKCGLKSVKLIVE